MISALVGVGTLCQHWVSTLGVNTYLKEGAGWVTLEDESLKAKISEEEKKTINNKCDEALKWLESNQLGEVDEFQDKQKELEVVCNPIISKFYQQGGAPGGTMPNGMPSGMPNGMPNGMAGGMPKGSASAGSNSGPTIEEVD